MEVTIYETRPVKVEHRQCTDIFKAVLEKLCAWDHYEVDGYGSVWKLGMTGHNGDTYREGLAGQASDDLFTVMLAARQLREALRKEKPAVMP